MYCKKCGKHIDKSYGGLCQGCYKYYKNGGTDSPLPLKGKIEYDNRGYVICHLCGRAYKRLGSHAKESHNITIAEYKETFGLCISAHTTETNYSIKMRESAYRHDMPKRLIEAGYKTRIKKGDKLRMGKRVRLQECLDKSARYTK